MFKSTAVKFSICFICSAFFLGCNVLQNQVAEEVSVTESMVPMTPVPAVTSTQAAQTTSVPSPIVSTPQPTEVPLEEKQKHAELLDALDLSIFTEFVTSDGYTLQRSLIAPKTYGIVVTDEMFSWNSYTQEALERKVLHASEHLNLLHNIDRSYLNDQDQLLFDTIEQYLQSIIDAGHLQNYFEPLEPGAGLQVQIPIMLSMFRLDSVEDVSHYFLLLQDTPRVFEEVLAFEQKRAELGLFMTQSALQEVLSDCEMIIHNQKSLYLKTSFSQALSEMDELSRSKRNAFIEQHNQIIQDSLIPAYETLRSGLAALESACREEQGIYVFGENAMRYFALQLCKESASDITPEDALPLLETALTDLLATMQAIYADDPKIADYGSLTKKTSTSKLLEELQEQTEMMLPTLPEDVSISVRKLSEDAGSIFSSAVFVRPAMDAASSYQILLNEKVSDDMLLLTLAHEAYPGHLYQFAYQQTLSDIGLLPQILPLSGYVEGWAQMAEEWLLLEQTKYDQNAAMFAFCSSMLSDALLPSIISIYVNYYGYEYDDVKSYLAQYGLHEESHVSLYYDYAVNHPYSKLRYGIGYAQLAEMMRNMSAVLGENYLQYDVLKRYLDYGPSYFNLLRERMDEWADAKVLE